MFFPINTGWFTWYCSGYSAPYKMHRRCPLSKSFGHVTDFEFFKFFNNSNAYFSFKILSRSGISHWRSSIKKGALKYFPKFKGKHLRQSLFFNKLQTLTQVFSCEFCKNFRKTFFTEHLPTTVSEQVQYFIHLIIKWDFHSVLLKHWRKSQLLPLAAISIRLL